MIPHVVLGVHGGTGRPKSEMTPELRRKYTAGLAAALQAGFAALNKPGSTSLDGVEAAVRVLEDDAMFNAGRGAVLTHDGQSELDASIMEGQTKRAGSVAGVTTIKHPISAARAVMQKSAHVMLIGRGAEQFAAEQKLELVSPDYFRTPERVRQLERLIREEEAEKKANDSTVPKGASKTGNGADNPPTYWGTVGAVAVDQQGNLAAATSTGGMSNKRFGRVGDSPIIGAGTYADNAGCAVSCTGHGEYFIRFAVAHSIVSLVKYRGLGVQAAADQVIQQDLRISDTETGEGAAIVLDPQGNFAASRNCEGLYRGWITQDGKIEVRLYDE
ncbi:MAG: isoaspartyl peptidase/L-asparaginase family protein [Pirellulales bacterium]